jgi:uncharacterized protein YegP (UPF0339 family)
MKDQARDQYDFNQSSPTDSPGFVVFRKEEGNWFFHCNNEKGNPVLYSQAYRTEDAAQKGLQSCLTNLQKGRVKMIQDGDSAYVVVIAGNHQEVGRSRAVDSQATADSAIQYLKNVAKAKNSMAKVEVEPATESEELSLEPEDTSRYAFRLSYYVHGDHDALSGKITYLPDGKTEKFSGVGLKEITALVKSVIDVANAEAYCDDAITGSAKSVTDLPLQTEAATTDIALVTPAATQQPAQTVAAVAAEGTIVSEPATAPIPKASLTAEQIKRMMADDPSKLMELINAAQYDQTTVDVEQTVVNKTAVFQMTSAPKKAVHFAQEAALANAMIKKAMDHEAKNYLLRFSKDANAKKTALLAPEEVKTASAAPQSQQLQFNLEKKTRPQQDDQKVQTAALRFVTTDAANTAQVIVANTEQSPAPVVDVTPVAALKFTMPQVAAQAYLEAAQAQKAAAQASPKSAEAQPAKHKFVAQMAAKPQPTTTITSVAKSVATPDTAAQLAWADQMSQNYLAERAAHKASKQTGAAPATHTFKFVLGE